MVMSSRTHLGRLNKAGDGLIGDFLRASVGSIRGPPAPYERRRALDAPSTTQSEAENENDSRDSRDVGEYCTHDELRNCSPFVPARDGAECGLHHSGCRTL